MSKSDKPVIVVKRYKKGGHGHHGGAWKIAYADFVTAMMAFFLLMWLLGSTTKGDLKGIADYFQTPLAIAMQGGPSVGSSNTLLPGGGKDLRAVDGQVNRGGVVETDEEAKKLREKQAERAEREKLETLKARIEQAIAASVNLSTFKKQLLLDITSEGLRIQIVDDQNRPMFDLSSAELKPYTREILRELGQMLNNVPNKLSLAGHTDATPFSGSGKSYGNWELSSDRANASRRELIAAGLEEPKIVRVVGLGSTVQFDKADAFSPANRRISIVVLTKKAQEAMSRDLPTLELESGAVPAAPSTAVDAASSVAPKAALELPKP
jgi:chemotaxis protein MotB